MSDGFITAEDLIDEEIPPREFFMEPLFFKGCLAMVYALPGIGKTWFTLWLATALASQGQFFKWKGQRECKVLYIDSEMMKAQLRPRFLQILNHSGFIVPQKSMAFITPDRFLSLQIPNIAVPESQAFYDQKALKADVIIIDNLGSASAPVVPRETEEQTWMRILPWFLKLRALGKCVILVHHAGKSGAQLGTSRREQPLDLIIKLTRPTDFEPAQGCRLQVSFDKARHVYGPDLEPLYITLKCDDVSMSWEWQTLTMFQKERVKEMLKVGFKETEICLELTLNRVKAREMIDEVKREMLNDVGGRDYYE